MLLGEVCKHIYMKMNTETWVDADELTRVVEKYSLSQEEQADKMTILKNYFLEFDETNTKVRLRPWAYDLFKNRLPQTPTI